MRVPTTLTGGEALGRSIGDLSRESWTDGCRGVPCGAVGPKPRRHKPRLIVTVDARDRRRRGPHGTHFIEDRSCFWSRSGASCCLTDEPQAGRQQAQNLTDGGSPCGSVGHIARSFRILSASLMAITMIFAVNSPAFATATASSNGGYATYTTSTNKMLIADNNCNGNPVYVKYKFTNSTSTAEPSNPSQHNYNGGCNGSETITLYPGGYSRIVFQHCNDDLPPDTCGAWVNTAA